MYPNICHIYGPLYLNCYGLFIAISILVFSFLIEKNPKFIKLITFEQFKNVIILSLILGILGGRLFWAIEYWHLIKDFKEIFAFWEPGYSFFGSLISILCIVPFYLKKINVSILPFLDLVAIYIPLLHAISRIGCFLAGCCHGIPTNSSWGIIYTHPDVVVPNNLKYVKIHPTQLYAFVSLVIIFLCMYYIFQKKYKKNGQLASIYLILGSAERFFNDFFRADREYFNIGILKYFSLNQWVFLLIFFIGIYLLIRFTYYSTLKNYNVRET